jgi:hypothetical protein
VASGRWPVIAKEQQVFSWANFDFCTFLVLVLGLWEYVSRKDAKAQRFFLGCVKKLNEKHGLIFLFFATLRLRAKLSLRLGEDGGMLVIRDDIFQHGL